MKLRSRLGSALFAVLLVGTLTAPSVAVGTRRCYDYGTDWRRSPWYFWNATQSGDKAALGQELRSPNYVAVSVLGGAYADEVNTNLKRDDATAVTTITHGAPDNILMIDKPSRSNYLSCLRISNIGSHPHQIDAVRQDCNHQRAVEDLLGDYTPGAELVVYQGCNTADPSGTHPHGLTSATYTSLYSAKAVVGFGDYLEGQPDSSGNDVISRRWAYVFWDEAAVPHTVRYSAMLARDSVFSYFGDYSGFETYQIVGNTDYKLPY